MIQPIEDVWHRALAVDLADRCISGMAARSARAPFASKRWPPRIVNIASTGRSGRKPPAIIACMSRPSRAVVGLTPRIGPSDTRPGGVDGSIASVPAPIPHRGDRPRDEEAQGGSSAKRPHRLAALWRSRGSRPHHLLSLVMPRCELHPPARRSRSMAEPDGAQTPETGSSRIRPPLLPPLDHYRRIITACATVPAGCRHSCASACDMRARSPPLGSRPMKASISVVVDYSSAPMFARVMPLPLSSAADQGRPRPPCMARRYHRMKAARHRHSEGRSDRTDRGCGWLSVTLDGVGSIPKCS